MHKQIYQTESLTNSTFDCIFVKTQHLCGTFRYDAVEKPLVVHAIKGEEGEQLGLQLGAHMNKLTHTYTHVNSEICDYIFYQSHMSGLQDSKSFALFLYLRISEYIYIYIFLNLAPI